jgi:prepilin-type processing-associated H-X9-DG protein
MRNVWEMLAVFGLALLVVFVLIPIFETPHTNRRMSCNSNLGQIVKACTTYQEPNGDYFPAFWDGERFDPMKSLALLYPAYIDNVRVFGCPSTKDQPEITVTVVADKEIRRAFGPVDTEKKCSYFYDERTNFRLIGPGQAMAADADGQTWLDAQGKHPSYPPNWTRQPRKPNHDNGQNVMYFDGHVKWMDTVYAGRSPVDNIFCPQLGWDPDTDAYLWDGVNARTAEIAR